MYLLKNLSPKNYHPASSAGKLQPRLIGGQAKKGFTLIEMLVVIAVIGILYGIVMASISNSKAKGRDAKRIADISVIQLALENYYDQYHFYPTSPNPGLGDPNLIAVGPIPRDPSTGVLYSYTSLTSDSSATCSSNCQSYHLGATLELNNGILDDDTVDRDNDVGFPGGGLVYDVLPKF